MVATSQSIFGTSLMELTLELVYEPHKEISFITLLSHLIYFHSHVSHSCVSSLSLTDFAFSLVHIVIANRSPKESLAVNILTAIYK